jgi:hypothetical protein
MESYRKLTNLLSSFGKKTDLLQNNNKKNPAERTNYWHGRCFPHSRKSWTLAVTRTKPVRVETGALGARVRFVGLGYQITYSVTGYQIAESYLLYVI